MCGGDAALPHHLQSDEEAACLPADLPAACMRGSTTHSIPREGCVSSPQVTKNYRAGSNSGGEELQWE